MKLLDQTCPNPTTVFSNIIDYGTKIKGDYDAICWRICDKALLVLTMLKKVEEIAFYCLLKLLFTVLLSMKYVHHRDLTYILFIYDL